MYVVIFRATLRALDAEYATTAQRMRELALRDFGCLAFHAVTEGDQEIAVSYWPSEEAIRTWKNHSGHLAAQRAGRERWYRSYTVEVSEFRRAYRSGVGA
jgi:heme-degrading monooxygenase HmoA